VSGIGEIIKPIEPLKDCHILIVKPIFGAKTKVVYQKYDSMPSLKRVDTDSIEKALKTNDLKLLCENMANVLQPVTQTMCKSILDIISKLESSGAKKAMM